jgi:hypothetical protein
MQWIMANDCPAEDLDRKGHSSRRLIMRWRSWLSAVLCVALPLLQSASGETPNRWTKDQADRWAKEHGWLVGCNFVPSTAVNSLEMWQAETFDPKTIDRELGWAQSLGYNSVRIFLNSLLWEADAKGFTERMEKFLSIADSHQIGAVFVLFDSCFNPDPKLGKQPDPIPRQHNSRWVQCPGPAVLNDPVRRERLKSYVVGVVGHFRNDRRVQFWDVWNEPHADLPPVLPTLEKAFGWTREANPTQPLTSGIWGNWRKIGPLEKLQLEQSDIITFHNYQPLAVVKDEVETLRRYGRPVICTEFMARTEGSTFDPILGYFRQQRVGAASAALVEGRIQCKYPWDSLEGKKYPEEPAVWFHDVFRKDGSPYDAGEVEYIRSITGAKKP